MIPYRSLPFVVWLLLGTTTAWSQDFGSQIRPLLADNCFKCHGPDDATREADLRLDRRTAAVDSNAFVPGDADHSELIQRINSSDPDLQMPPPSTGKQLTEDQKALLTRWINSGAEYANHWAFQRPERPEVPRTSADSRISTALDAFVVARLEAEGLALSPQADVVTLIRRLHFDLVGLPPTPEVVDEWVERLTNGDKPLVSDQAWKQLVETLLKSQHYGERWAQHWLDAARYADSDGFEKDKPRFVWSYRDWVIDALNRDLPYDQFIIEQIAGDLLPNRVEDQIVATGFLRNSMINEEGGIDPEQFRMEAMFDRMDAIGKSILGLTIQCAQCHSHKFDPFTQQEYYQLFAFLNNSHEANIAAYTPNDEKLRESLFAQIRKIETDLQAADADWPQQMSEWEKAYQQAQIDWQTVRPEEDTSGGQKHYVLEDSSILAAGYAPTKHETTFYTTTDLPKITAVKLELLTDQNLPRGGPGRSIYGLCALTEFKLRVEPADGSKPFDVPIASATASVNPAETALDTIFYDKTDKKRVTGPIEFAIDGKDETAWSIDIGPGRSNVPQEAVFVLKEPVQCEAGARLVLRVRQMHGGWNSDDNQNNNLGRFRFAVTAADQPEADLVPLSVREILARKGEQRTPEDLNRIFSHWRTTVKKWKDANRNIEDLWQQHPQGSTQLVLQEREVRRPTALLERGNFLKPRKAVAPNVPQFLHPLNTASDTPNRLDFARWLSSRESPTTARAFVNRIWQSYFGTGLVATSEDLGTQSPPPSHPELLDWLAVEFMEHGWSLKELHRVIVQSDVYRQSSRMQGELAVKGLSVDPTNRLLWRFPRQRVDGEIVRDAALSASGILNLKVGGPSVHPPAPEFLFQPPASYGPKTWKVDLDEDRYRRSLYTFRFRSVPYPVLQNFDVPPGETACVRRTASNTPLQALTTLNQTTFVEAARALAAKTLAEAVDSDKSRIKFAFRRVLSRLPTSEEQKTLAELLQRQQARFLADLPRTRLLAGQAEDQAPTDETDQEAVLLASWTVLARVLLNLDEAISKE